MACRRCEVLRRYEVLLRCEASVKDEASVKYRASMKDEASRRPIVVEQQRWMMMEEMAALLTAGTSVEKTHETER